MAISVHPMTVADVDQVMEIEREAFPTQWPPTSFRRELQNRLAHYFVARDDKVKVGGPTPPTNRSWLRRLFRSQPAQQDAALVVGMWGMWMLYDEAHITTVAVREVYRRQGIGELLLLKAIERAQELGAGMMTLEVRASNLAAQALYEKCGFHRLGVRRGYYSDNHEDGIIMTTDPFASVPFQALLQRLREEHTRRWGARL
jgi:ribosomal-protein-alanine N-acetyltransferase